MQSSSLLALGFFMEAFLVSTGVVALGEMGDKTQLLAIVLAAAFRKPLPIILGILVATLANHAAAGAVGGWSGASSWTRHPALGHRRVVPGDGGLDTDPGQDRRRRNQRQSRFGVFGTTVIAFFLAEMGDKTQIATVALATHAATPTSSRWCSGPPWG